MTNQLSRARRGDMLTVIDPGNQRHQRCHIERHRVIVLIKSVKRSDVVACGLVWASTPCWHLFSYLSSICTSNYGSLCVGGSTLASKRRCSAERAQAATSALFSSRSPALQFPNVSKRLVRIILFERRL